MNIIGEIAVFDTVANLKLYDGSAAIAVVQETAHQGIYFNDSTATADEEVIYAGADGRKWKRTLAPEIEEALNANQGVWGTFTGTLSDQTDLQAELDDKADADNPLTTGTFKHGDGVTTTILDGNGDAQTPDFLVSKAAAFSSLGVFANDGTQNRRISLFADVTNGVNGISTTHGGAAAPFVIRNAAGERLRINTNGTLQFNAYTTAGYLKNNVTGDISSVATIAKADVTGIDQVDNTSDANKPVSTATQTALDAKQDALISGTNLKTINSIDLLGSGDIPISIPSRVFLGSDVVNSTTSFADVTGLQFPVIAGEKYEFKFFFIYTSAATTTGAAFSVNGPALTSLNYISTATISSTSIFNQVRDTYNAGVASSNSIFSILNIGLVEGVIECSASGNVVARFASGVGGSAITVKGGKSYVSYTKIN